MTVCQKRLAVGPEGHYAYIVTPEHVCAAVARERLDGGGTMDDARPEMGARMFIDAQR